MLLKLVALAVAFTAVPVIAQAPDSPIIVRSASSRAEIQRILNADNFDTANLDARDVAEGMAQIERGRAPEDFWSAYQTHVRAWQKLADAEDQARIAMMSDPRKMAEAAAILAEAEDQIEVTFTAVERIALDYGARMPIPPDELARTA